MSRPRIVGWLIADCRTCGMAIIHAYGQREAPCPGCWSLDVRPRHTAGVVLYRTLTEAERAV